MHPTLPEQPAILKIDQDRRTQWLAEEMSGHSPTSNRRLRSEDSWIEISSQPSSTSLCSQDNEIVTSGLHIRPGSRRAQFDTHQPPSSARSASVAGSSQDEYDESESDSDRIMSSSNEDINQRAEEEDGTATTIGVGARNIFTPQPNAFSHPPQSGNSHSTPTPGSYFPSNPPTALSDRLPSNRIITQQTIRPRPVRREIISTSRAQPDHDAALRASLTTLLSCAAAVGPSKDTKERTNSSLVRPSLQPTTLRLVPESELNATDRSQKPATKRRSRESSKERHAKKIRAVKGSSGGEDVLSPTVMTWMISAGVVLVFSAISFSAGYAWGKEVGRIEGEMGISTGNCGQEALRAGGLRKLRWSAAAQSARAYS